MHDSKHNFEPERSCRNRRSSLLRPVANKSTVSIGKTVDNYIVHESKHHVKPASRCSGLVLLPEYQCNPRLSRFPSLNFPDIQTITSAMISRLK